MLVRNPSLAAVAVFSLSAGITFTSVMFSLVDGMWLRPSPFKDTDRVIRVFASSERHRYSGFSYPDFLELQRQMQSLSGLAAVQYRGANLFREELSEQLIVAVVSRNFFSVLGIRPHLGQFFSEDDETALKGEPVVVLSHDLWQRSFGGNPDVVGKPIRLSGRSVVVMGIAPPSFSGARRMVPSDVWYPIETWGRPAERATRDVRAFDLVGRLCPSYTVRQAQAEAETIFKRLDLKEPATRMDQQALVLSEARFQYEGSALYSLLPMGIVSAVLLIACANVSGLLLAKAEVRRREMAIRLALGAGRARLVRQLLTEGILLSLIAVAVSLLLAHWMISSLPAILPPRLASVDFGARLDVRVVAFTVIIGVLTTLLFSLAPALYASRPALVPVLKGDLVPSGPRRKCDGLNALVVSQLALALILTTLASLLVKSLFKCHASDLGFDKKKKILLADLGPPGDEEYVRTFYRQLKERLRALPGVKRVSLARCVPFSLIGGGVTQKVFLSPDRTSAGAGGWAIKFNLVDPEYFRTMGIQILRGRDFNEHDGHSGQRAVMINDTMAKRFWPKEDPIGKWIRIGDANSEPAQIVGLVQGGKYNAIDEPPEPYFYIPFAQMYWVEMTLIVETAVDPAALVHPVRKEIRSLSKTIDLYPMNTMQEYVRSAMFVWDVMTKLLTFLGLLGLGLASIGLYGLISYAVNRRTQEIGIRMALGAQRRDVLKTVMRRGGWLVVIGVALGLPIALASAHVLRGFLYEVRPVDPAVVALSVVVLLGVAALATYLPARKATKVDPMVALRYE